MCSDRLVEGNQLFSSKILEQDPAYFEDLQAGQSPDYFVISCSDSRVSPSVISNSPLGTMFVHRNIANQVRKDDDSLAASLYYALVHLKVKKIIIKGHTGCGGVAAAQGGNEEPHLKGWIKGIKEGFSSQGYSADNDLQELVKANVKAQVEQMKNHPVYKEYGGNTEVAGYLFDLGSGKLEQLDV
ncbi:carbonic anhydrase [Halobacillus sp. Marseille-Q1614]|uniref:carbonic anhydrase n=1 Tax=Halobacillus sp. Marseille-Q1614 TaxID=2709134 RepID=UPI00156F0B0C|nr:carbonic anhydrase [Halobacillus sp. Marseille-Q1614]